MKLLLLVCLSVVFALVQAGCNRGYNLLNKKCTKSRECYADKGVCQYGECCRAAPNSCPAGMRAMSYTCNHRYLCPSGQYRCIQSRCCKLEFCRFGFTKTTTKCTSSIQCGAGGHCMMGICCKKDTPADPKCPPGFLNPTKKCTSTANCESGASCILGNCCPKAVCRGLDKMMNPVANWQCDDLTPCPHGYYCHGKRCCKTIKPCAKPYFNVGKECTFSVRCERSTDKCNKDTGYQCCRQPAKSCPSGYFMSSKTCDKLNPCPAGSPYTCIDGRCCRKVLGGCPGNKYYTGHTCVSGMKCTHPAVDSCERGMCCRAPAPGCPRRHYTYTDKSRTCNLFNKCPSPWRCIRGRCCYPATCPYNYLWSPKICSKSTQCGTYGYCQYGQCCTWDTRAICPTAYRSIGKICSANVKCPSGTICYSRTGRCCRVSQCRTGYRFSRNYCSRYRSCPTGKYCNYGRCCYKVV